MSLQQAALQALEALESDPDAMVEVSECHWDYKRDLAITALKQALAEPEQPVAIKWTLNGDKHCGYDNWVGETPFGRILITWKSWKDFPEACVDEFPGGFEDYGDPDDVKDECEAEFRRRLGAAPTPHKPLTDEQKLKLVTNWFAEDWAIKQALGLLHDYDIEAKQGEQT